MTHSIEISPRPLCNFEYTDRRTRAILEATGFITLVEKVDSVGIPRRAESATHKTIVADAVTMVFFQQNAFDFNDGNFSKL